MLKVTPIPVLQDNYSYLIQSDNIVGVVDPGDAAPIIDFCENKKIKPDFIFNTHHHGDHTAGNTQLCKKYDAQLIAPENEKKRISDIDITVAEKTALRFGNENVEIIETAGHTSGHVCFYFPQSHILFSGDTLFVMGCGRLFEGTAQQMFDSFKKIKELPDDTLIYCGHEYTLDNARFAQANFPDNRAVTDRLERIIQKRKNEIPTIPTTIGKEKQTNPFMLAKTVEAFADLRTKKDNF